MTLSCRHPSAHRNASLTYARPPTPCSSRLSAEDQTPQSMPDASPTKWHRAHTTWFFEEFVLRPDPTYTEYDPSYRYLFNSYYEAVGPRHPRPQRGLVTRPGVADVARYREYVAGRARPGARRRPARRARRTTLVELGCNHEQQHQELLLMDIKHLFSTHAFAPVYVERPADDRTSADAADLACGRPVAWSRSGTTAYGFAYDNEGPRHRVLPRGLRDRRARGHQRRLAGVHGRRRLPARRPVAVRRLGAGPGRRLGRAGLLATTQDGAWTTFTLSGRRPVVPAEPVCHVSFYEADAFARWAGARLPTEFEWETAAAQRPDLRGQLLDPDRVPSRASPARRWSATSGSGRASAYLPYPGFRPGQRRGRRVQRQVHVRPARAARRERGHPGRARTADLPQLLPGRTRAGRSAACGWPDERR